MPLPSKLRPIPGDARFQAEGLQATEGDADALVADIPLPMWVYDVASLRILSVNAAAQKVYGYSRDEFLQLSTDLLHGEEDRPRYVEHVRHGAGTSGRVRVRHLTKDGRPLQVDVIGEPVTVSGRRARRVIVVDVAATVEVEEERAQLSHAVEQAAESIVITDAVGTILYVNPAFERVSGYDRAELLDANCRLLKSGEQPASFYDEMWQTLRAGRVWRGRFVNRRKDGSLFEEEATISPVRDEYGVLRNYVGVKRDITRERQLEEQVRHSAKMEAVGRLAGGVAHDFNNLLNVVIGYAELGLRKLGSENEARRHLTEILRAADRAASLTRQLLAFSRRQVLQPRVVDLNAIVRDMDRLLGRVVGEDVHIRTRIAALPLFVVADPGQIEQVVMNLAVNARDAMAGGGELVLETAAAEIGPGEGQEVPAGPYVSLSVTDTGCGMDPDTVSHVFEPFFTTKPEGKGTGLGLSTVWGIVKQSGGTVGIRSRVGAGTTFRILLPRATAPGPGETTGTAPEVPRSSPATRRVMVVDDEAPLRSIIRDVLEAAGHSVVEAGSGEEALAAAAPPGAAVDLLVTDLTMPGMDGAALAHRLRARLPSLKVVLMSGMAEASGPAGPPEATFLAKPFTTGELEQAVRDALA